LLPPIWPIPTENAIRAKRNARLIVSQIVLDTLKQLKMDFPKVGPERQQELLSIREQLTK